jgi:hypothetical protein
LAALDPDPHWDLVNCISGAEGPGGKTRDLCCWQHTVLWIRIRIYLEPHSFGCLGSGSVLVSMRIRIQVFISMWIRIRIRYADRIQEHGNCPKFINIYK